MSNVKIEFLTTKIICVYTNWNVLYMFLIVHNFVIDYLFDLVTWIVECLRCRQSEHVVSEKNLVHYNSSIVCYDWVFILLVRTSHGIRAKGRHRLSTCTSHRRCVRRVHFWRSARTRDELSKSRSSAVIRKI